VGAEPKAGPDEISHRRPARLDLTCDAGEVAQTAELVKFFTNRAHPQSGGQPVLPAGSQRQVVAVQHAFAQG
jgi:hypothetical protein